MNDSDKTLKQPDADQKQSADLSRHRDPPPAKVEGFTILHCLGEGAFGSVWLAQKHNTRTQVAIKFFTNRQGMNWALLSREVEKLAALDESRRIVSLNHVELNSTPPYYVMEFLEKGSLASYLSEGALPVHESVRVAKSVLQALVHAHGSGILHCDLKPANVLLDSDFEPRLCDFGQSRLSGESTPSLGTLFYMAPEQADLKAVPDARWDVYALGALLYQMICGHAPFRTPENEQKIRDCENVTERLDLYRKIIKESPRPNEHRKVSGVDRRLADIIDRCLTVDPQKRFPNAQAVLDSIEQRERYHSRRPLIALGIIGPLLLIAAMYPLAKHAMNDSLGTARKNTIERALESDSLSATILAGSIEHELEDRQLELERIANEPWLRKAVSQMEGKTREERDVLFARLKKQKQNIDQEVKKKGRATDLSWYINDVQGYHRWREPYSAIAYDKLYSYRDYFHGHGKEYPKESVPQDIKPIDSPHISLAYQSSVTKKFMFAIAVPVFAPEDSSKVIGVLSRTLELDELPKLVFPSAISGKTTPQKAGKNIERVVSLVEYRDWLLLAHPWMTKENLAELSQLGEHSFDLLSLKKTVSQETLLKIEQQASGNSHQDAHKKETTLRFESYTDPVGRISLSGAKQYQDEWLAALAPVGKTGWLVIVQERKPAAMRPVEELQHRLVANGIWAVAISLSLMGLLWLFVMLAMTNQSERLAIRGGVLRNIKSGGILTSLSERDSQRKTPS
ncbi:Serine/threonine protein kinase [hydrothermal vent metagenome]|uniref:Serine/threonine protein kinase n=1 Tax=hydrothermal vent metagenome TaxID=652676 RepID=A0A3B1DW03_9ZZZZ